MSSPISSSIAASKSGDISSRAFISPSHSTCLRSSIRSRRIWSIARRLAAAISHAPGLSGTPASGHFSTAATSASCAKSSARPMSPTMRARRAMSRGDSMRQTASIAPYAADAAPSARRPSTPRLHHTPPPNALNASNAGDASNGPAAPLDRPPYRSTVKALAPRTATPPTAPALRRDRAGAPYPRRPNTLCSQVGKVPPRPEAQPQPT